LLRHVFIPFHALTCMEFYFLQRAVYTNTNFNTGTNPIIIPQCLFFYPSLFTAAVLSHAGILCDKATVLGETIKETSCIIIIIIIISL
jgi:F0F1-type ATP synthase assembly protein I